MRVTVVRPGDLGSTEAASWAKFQHASPMMSNPFLSLTFAQAVGRYRPSARVAVVEEDGQVDAFLPFELASRKVAVPIGHPMNEQLSSRQPRGEAEQTNSSRAVSEQTS